MTDQKLILQNQYKDVSNLNARIAIHLRFSTNPYGWFEWVFDRMELPSGCRILEVGCGPGKLWTTNLDRLSTSWQLVLSDFSHGMVAQAESTLQAAALQNAGALQEDNSHFSFTQADAGALPFPSNYFDVLVANHMLYHVPDKHRALEEFRRVLRNDGHLYAATIGKEHMKELHDLEERFDPRLERIDMDIPSFNLENGGNILEKHFSSVCLERYEDSLEVTDSALLADYVLSTAGRPVSAETKANLLAFFKERIEADGAIHITKDSGMFIARK